MSYNCGKRRTFVPASATVIEADRFVILKSGGIQHSADGEQAIGISEYGSASGETNPIPVWMLDETSKLEVEFDSAASKGDRVASADDGKAKESASGDVELGTLMNDVAAGAVGEIQPDRKGGTTA